jgi:hypothetical protein
MKLCEKSAVTEPKQTVPTAIKDVLSRQLVNPHGNIVSAQLLRAIDTTGNSGHISCLDVDALAHIMQFQPVFVGQVVHWMEKAASAHAFDPKHFRLLWCTAQVSPEGPATFFRSLQVNISFSMSYLDIQDIFRLLIKQPGVDSDLAGNVTRSFVCSMDSGTRAWGRLTDRRWERLLGDIKAAERPASNCTAATNDCTPQPDIDTAPTTPAQQQPHLVRRLNRSLKKTNQQVCNCM